MELVEEPGDHRLHKTGGLHYHDIKFRLPFLGAYLLYSWGTQEFERLKRKNPADYENDQ
nr:PREDICTED: cytochrome b-c1 complex subunit 8 [Opisthocomus hoazin]